MKDYFDHREYTWQCRVPIALMVAANCLGWVRTGDEDHDGCAVVLCNGTADGSKKMEVGKVSQGSRRKRS